MAHIKLVDKDNNLVTENPNLRLETIGRLNLPRQLEHEGKLYVFDSKEGPITVYKSQ